MWMSQAQPPNFLINILVIMSFLFVLGCDHANTSQQISISHPSNPGTLFCQAIRYESERILGGDLVSEESFFARNSVYLQISAGKTQKNCGAVFLNDQTLLTVAHCVDGVLPDQIVMKLGNQIPCPTDALVQSVFRVTQIIIHPQFRNNFSFEKQSNLFNENGADLAVVKFEKVIEPPFAIAFAKLPFLAAGSAGGFPRVLTVAGYGIHFQDISGQKAYSLNLRLGRVHTLSNPELAGYDQSIKEFLEKRVELGAATLQETIDLNSILATEPLFSVDANSDKIFLDQSKGQGICLGDSGSGAFQFNEQSQQFELVGLHSSVFNWTDASRPCSQLGILTNLNKYRRWIETMSTH